MNMKTLEHRRAKIAVKKTADKELAESLRAQIDGKQVDFKAKAGESGKLFGSVTSHDIIEALNDKLGFELDRRKLLLDSSIKETGIHEVRYRVYPEVEALIKVNITAEGAPEQETIAEEVPADEAKQSSDDETASEADDPAPEDDTDDAVIADEAKQSSEDETASEADDPAPADDTDDAVPVDDPVIASEAKQSSDDETPADDTDEALTKAEEEMIFAEEAEENSGS
jgi:large subunit ribosomal protein L9